MSCKGLWPFCRGLLSFVQAFWGLVFGWRMKDPHFHIGSLRAWKSHAEETGSWRRSSLISGACVQQNNWLPPHLQFARSRWEDSVMQVASYLLCKEDGSGYRKPWASRCQRKNSWCVQDKIKSLEDFGGSSKPAACGKWHRNQSAMFHSCETKLQPEVQLIHIQV